MEQETKITALRAAVFRIDRIPKNQIIKALQDYQTPVRLLLLLQLQGDEKFPESYPESVSVFLIFLIEPDRKSTNLTLTYVHRQ